MTVYIVRSIIIIVIENAARTMVKRETVTSESAERRKRR